MTQRWKKQDVKNLWHGISKSMNEIGNVNGMLESVNEVEHDSEWDVEDVWMRCDYCNFNTYVMYT